MQPSYDWDECVFTLSIFSNLVTGERGTVSGLERSLASKLAKALRVFSPELGEWDVVWGPAIFQSGFILGLADNVMYVARRRRPASSRTEYVVAISAVNSKSLYDWFVEDLNIATQARWWDTSARRTTEPKIAKGVDIGFTHLVKLRDGKTLMDFLEDEVRGRARVTVTGHSFGGALAPAVALWLHEQQSTWDPRRRCEIACLISGAPSPGNADFASLYARSGLSRRTTHIENKLDLACHLWNAADIPRIPSLYVPHVPVSPLIEATMAKFRALSISAGGYTRIDGGRTRRVHAGFKTDESPKTDSNTLRFLKQEQYQHIVGYFDGLGLSKLRDSYLREHPKGFGMRADHKDVICIEKSLRLIR